MPESWPIQADDQTVEALIGELDGSHDTEACLLKRTNGSHIGLGRIGDDGAYCAMYEDMRLPELTNYRRCQS